MGSGEFSPRIISAAITNVHRCHPARCPASHLMRALTLAPVPVSKGAARGKIVQSTGQSGWRRFSIGCGGKRRRLRQRCPPANRQRLNGDERHAHAGGHPRADAHADHRRAQHGPGTGCAARGHDASARARHGETQGSGTSRTATRTARGATQDGRASTATAAGGQLSPAHQQRELLRAGRVLPGYRPRGKRGGRRWQDDQVRRQQRLALGARLSITYYAVTSLVARFAHAAARNTAT